MFRDNMTDFRDVVLKGERLYVGKIYLDFSGGRERPMMVKLFYTMFLPDPSDTGSLDARDLATIYLYGGRGH